jgi:hypothetical protein
MNEEEIALAEAYAKKIGVPADLVAVTMDEPISREEAKRLENEYGIDPTLSRENAIEASALRIRDRLAAGDDEGAILKAAVGGDGRRLRRLTNKRTAVGQMLAESASRRTASGAAPPAPVAAPGPAPAPIAAVPAVTPMPPDAPPAGEPEATGGVPMVPPGALKAYAEGRMSPDDAIEMEIAVERGEFAVPAGFALRRTEKGMIPSGVTEAVKGIPAAIGEAITGSQRRTATTEAASDLTMSPEWRRISSMVPQGPRAGAGLGEQVVEGVKSALSATPVGPLVAGFRTMGLEAASPEEQIQILAANNPNMRIQRDEKGNAFFISEDGQTYSVQPGLRATDAPRAVATMGAFLPAGRATSVLGAVGAEAATQLGLEAAQASAGGSVDPTEVALAGATGGLVPAVQALRQGVRGARGAAEVAGAVEDVTQAIPTPGAAAATMPDEQVGARVLAASRGNAQAQAELIEAARMNPEAVDAQQVLGVELPMDVLADSPQIKDVAALVRSQLGGEAKAAFEGKIVETAKAIDDGLAAMDAGSLAQVSDKALRNLQDAASQAKSQARALYREVDDVLKPNQLVRLDNVNQLIVKRMGEVNGNLARLSPAEQHLYDIVTSKPTYQVLRDARTDIGAAARGAMANSPYGSTDKARLMALDAALRADQLAIAEQIGGEALKKKLKIANLMTLQQKRIEERAIKAFGKDLQGDISPLAKRALVEGSKDSGKAFRQMLNLVPKESQKETIASAISAVTRTADGGFDFAKYRTMYEGWRRNPEVYAGIVNALGPDADRFLQSAFVLSKRITDARGRKPPTGQSLQRLGLSRPQRLVDKVMESVLGRVAVSAAGAAASGPAGAIAGPVVADMIAKSRPDMVKAAADLMRSDEFQRLAIEGARGEPGRAATRKVATSSAWRNFARAANMPRDPAAGEQWLRASMQTARQGSEGVR